MHICHFVISTLNSSLTGDSLRCGQHPKRGKILLWHFVHMLSELPSGKRCQVNSLRNWNLCLSKDNGKNRNYLLYSIPGFNLEYFDSRLIILLENCVPKQQKTLHTLYQIQQIVLARKLQGNAPKLAIVDQFFLTIRVCFLL